MEENAATLLFQLIRSAMWGAPLDEDVKALPGEVWGMAAKLAQKHDVAHLFAQGMKDNGLSCPPILEKERVKAIYRYEQLQYELEQSLEALEAGGILHLPLKGSVLRHAYPKPWMRTSCDIDILIHPQDLDRAIAQLESQCHYTAEGTGSHDVSMHTPSGMHLELHYDLLEETVNSAVAEILRRVWEYTLPVVGTEYRRAMTDDMFYFYHIAHMAKHFENGGCGIRPLLDLKILDHKEDRNTEGRTALLQQGGLVRFTEVASQLSEVWFGEGTPNDLTRQTEHYILTGGVYGNMENRVMVQQQRKGGRLKYALSRIFLPYESMKFYYPVLQKHPWLLPLMEVRRWFRLLFLGGAKRSVRELQANSRVSTTEAQQIQAFLQDLGLDHP